MSETYIEGLVFCTSEDFVGALDLVGRVVRLVDGIQRVGIVGAGRIQLHGAARRMELDAHLLLRWKRRREIRWLFNFTKNFFYINNQLS